ncbi:hypothetical protein ABIA31_006994 [Catenulispora sp. MAP5-51]|uniref:hypothetical protein n=1 Tax=Catenulispora sp. MAP5-51 TaxID=3156298 RepID=UPI003516CC3A
MSWYPEPDEALVHRGPARFATGRAEKVAGMRWFRDETGRDIAAELPGWPEGPAYSPRSDAAARTTKTAWGIGKAVVFTAALAVNAVSNANPTVNLGDGARPTDPAREVEDFPVLVAAPGTIARGLPHQLDPDRRAKQYRTDLVVTDRRLVVLGTIADGGLEHPEVLWEAPRGALASVVKHAFGSGGADVSFVFADGSWARLGLENVAAAIQVAHELEPSCRVELTELAVKKLEPNYDKPPADHEWETIRQDNGRAVAQLVFRVRGKTFRTKQKDVTKWVDAAGD